MGQYFKGIILGENKKTVKAFVYSHDYGSGLKLMEHSWQGNKFVGSFESLILNNPQRVVWAGDYADNCKGRKTNLYSRAYHTDREYNDRKATPNQVNPTTALTTQQSRYVINHTKKTFVDKYNGLKTKWCGWKIHPLPLLTCEGNGRGGGDFRGESSLIGLWARDLISVSTKKPKGYTELIFDLIED